MSLISVSQLGALRTLFPDKKIGVAFSCFDLFHAGHVLMLQDSKSQCDILVIGFQTDPTVNRPHKNKPVQSVDERRIQIQGSKYIDYIVEKSRIEKEERMDRDRK
jgi:glycerol-3-phosphate cytidylyltransferase